MSAAHSPLDHAIEHAIDSVGTRQIPAGVNALTAVGLLGGLAAVGYGLSTAGQAWFWGAFLVATVYTMAIAQAGVIFACIQTGVQGRWGRPLKRVGESFAGLLIVAYLMLATLLIFGIGVYPWNPATFLSTGPVGLAPHSPAAIASKEFWLTPGFFMARHLGGFGFLIVLDLIYVRASLRPDLIAAKARLGTKAPQWWDSIIGAPEPLEAAVARSVHTQSRLAPVIGVFYALYFSLVGFDLIMTLSPLWYSNMFGGWIFMSSLWLGWNFIAATSNLGRDWLGFGGVFTKQMFHDLGRMILAWTMFWAYTLYAQILPIWYADVPEETEFLLVRMMLPQWSWLAQVVAVMCFIAPFVMLTSRGLKKMRGPFLALNALIISGVFLERSLLVMPSVYFGDTFPMTDFIIVNGGLWLFVLGAFAAIVPRVLNAVPALPVADPFLQPHPWDQHVHSLDGHGHH
jgi:hypothetical protein